MIIHEAIVINVREADDLKIAQHFSAGTRRVSRTEPVKRATEKLGLCVARPFLSSASRTAVGHWCSFPSDKSLGYSRTSASRTSLGTALARHVNE